MKDKSSDTEEIRENKESELLELDKSAVKILGYASAEPYFRALPVNRYAIAIPPSYYGRVSKKLSRELVKIGVASAIHEDNLYFVMHEATRKIGIEDLFNTIVMKCREVTNNACSIIGKPEYVELNAEKHLEVIRRLIYRLIETEYIARHGKEAIVHRRAGLFLPYVYEKPDATAIEEIVKKLRSEADRLCKMGQAAECASVRDRLLQVQNMQIIAGLALTLQIISKGLGILYVDYVVLAYTTYTVDNIVKSIWIKRADLCNMDKRLCKQYDSMASLDIEKHHRTVTDMLDKLGFSQTIKLAYLYCRKPCKDLELKELVFNRLTEYRLG